MLPIDVREDSLRRYLAEVAASQPLPSREEVALASRMKRGDSEARAKLIEANLRFVVSVAREYQNRCVPLADLISAGNLGLIIAAERFDETKGVRFISYAVWWIRQVILQTLAETSRLVRLPMNRVDLLRQINHFVSHSQQEHAGLPSEGEIADALGVSLDDVNETLALARHIRSLDAALGEDEENSLLEILPDETQESPDVLLARESLRAAVDVALDTLDEREREVIRLYYGLDGDFELTLGAIGARFGLTRERVRQIKEKALRKLRSPARARRLMAYAEEM